LRPYPNGARAEWRKCALTKLRMVEIAVAVVLTLAAVLAVGLTLWAAKEETGGGSEATLDETAPH
jgi:hypothetical protein